jgi:hypothetical protein
MRLQLETTDPDIFAAVLAVATAYERLWQEIRIHPSDKHFVSGMLGYIHAANVLPQLENL